MEEGIHEHHNMGHFISQIKFLTLHLCLSLCFLDHNFYSCALCLMVARRLLYLQMALTCSRKIRGRMHPSLVFENSQALP